jgi:uncharacterized protein (TIGR03118 family)
VVDNLVSDLPDIADFQDPNLVNPWGLAASATSPFWVANNGAGTSTLYNGSGEPSPQPTPLVVTIPPPGGGTGSAPTGALFNGGSSFELAPGRPARFIFATEDGTISGWNPAVNPTVATLQVDQNASGAVYKGLAIGNNGVGDFLYAANFGGGKIDVFDSAFSLTSLGGSFQDPSIPSGFAPFNVQNLNNKLYVTYALKQPGGEDDIAGPGHGHVSVFDLNGNLISHLISAGALNSPWGLSLAPEGFGRFEGDLLVGNFGDGRINVYDPDNGVLIDSLRDVSGNPIEIDGLWALRTGNGGQGGDPDDLYFTAGIAGEQHGLFGEISSSSSAVPDGGASTGLLLGASAVGLLLSRRKS